MTIEARPPASAPLLYEDEDEALLVVEKSGHVFVVTAICTPMPAEV